MGRHAGAPDGPRRRPAGPGGRPRATTLAALALAVAVTTVLVLAWGGVAWSHALLLGLAAAVVVGAAGALAATMPPPPAGPPPRRDDDEPVQ